MKIRMHHFFTGFTSWVCNESDGSVTMKIQGEQHDIDGTLETIGKSH